MRQILLSESFLSERAYRSQIKSPTDLVVGVIKGLDLDLDLKIVPGVLNQMGQDLGNPPEAWQQHLVLNECLYVHAYPASP